MGTIEKISGTQSLRRGLDILRILAGDHSRGLRMGDVIERSGLERSTAHRLLTCLCEEQFAERDPATRRYHLGLASMQLGFDTAQRLPLVDTYRLLMQRIARVCGDTVFLIARQGDSAICLHREEGSFPVRITTTIVGSVRPLGIGAGGTAILAQLDESDVERIHAAHRTAFDAAHLPLATLQRTVTQTRRRGFSETINAITSGITAVGMAIPNGGELPFAALSIGAISPRMNTQRRGELGHLLREMISQIPDAKR